MQEVPRTLRCEVITLLHTWLLTGLPLPGFHLPLYQRHYTMGFIYDIRHAAATENIAVYIIVIYWTSCSADCWPNVRPGLWCLEQCTRAVQRGN